MDIRAKDVHRAILRQCTEDIAEAEPQALGRLVVDFMDFVLSDAPADSAAAIKQVLETTQIAEWDEASWVVPELARATLDALSAWQSVAEAVLERLKGSDDTEATRELRDRLSAALGRTEKLRVDQDNPGTARLRRRKSTERPQNV